MKTKQLFLIFLLHTVLAFSMRAEEFRVQESLHFKSTILNKEIAYSIVLPADYFVSGKSYPVIYFLHGLGDDETSWLEYGQIEQYMDRMVDEGTISSFINIIPQGFRSYFSNFYSGDFAYQDMFVQELVPFIDTHYRTLSVANKRAVMGYSMGGFGALILPLKYPEIFGVSIPLSASIRTDKQYIDEDQKGWDQQWGKIFGAEGATGSERISDYYQKNSPFHIIRNMKPENLNPVAFFIENGDKENTLCRSNEELHMLMVEKNIPHIYNVRAGGHDFQFWCESIPEAFRFADCLFQNKTYEVLDNSVSIRQITKKAIWNENISLSTGEISVFYPENPKLVRRSFPTVYFISKLSANEQEKLISLYQQDLKKGFLTPMSFCFLQPESDGKTLDEAIQYMEKQKTARGGRRFRALWSFQHGGSKVLGQAMIYNKFTACVFTESEISLDEPALEQLVISNDSTKDNLRLYIDTSPTGATYLGNGFLHIILKEHGFIHEYRVRHQSKTSFSFLMSGFLPATNYLSKRFHH